MSNPLHIDAPRTLIDDLLDGYAIPDKEFEIKLARGEVFVFKAVTDPAAFEQLKARALKSLSAFWDETTGKPVPGEWEDIRPPNRELAVHCYMLYETCLRVETGGQSQKLSQRDWLVFCHDIHAVFLHLRTLWNQFQSNRIIWDQMEEAKRQGEDLSGNLGTN